MSQKVRNSVLTIAERRAMYERIVDESMEWLNIPIGEIVKKLSEMYHFEVNLEGRTREQMLRKLFLAHMKRMIE